MEPEVVELGLGEVKYPIPLSWEGNAVVGDLCHVSLVHLDGDESCMWVADRKSALFLQKKGHKILKTPEILEKQKLFRRNPEFREKYPFWFD